MNSDKLYKTDLQDSVNRSKNRVSDFAEYMDRTDKEIWREFKLGNVDVLIYMYHKYVAQLLRFGLQFAPREVVKDSIQDLFLYLKERKNHAGEVKNISAYLYKCLYRIVHKKVEHTKNMSSIELSSVVKNWRIVVSSEITLIEKENNREQEIRLQQLLESLSAKQRQAILLYYYEGFTHQEITDIMELKNKSSVRKLIYRALDMLKDGFSA
jgi:RNA polymerase sigma-70 factor (ECF subfamily)